MADSDEEGPQHARFDQHQRAHVVLHYPILATDHLAQQVLVGLGPIVRRVPPLDVAEPQHQKRDRRGQAQESQEHCPGNSGEDGPDIRRVADEPQGLQHIANAPHHRGEHDGGDDYIGEHDSRDQQPAPREKRQQVEVVLEGRCHPAACASRRRSQLPPRRRPGWPPGYCNGVSMTESTMPGADSTSNSATANQSRRTKSRIRSPNVEPLLRWLIQPGMFCDHLLLQPRVHGHRLDAAIGARPGIDRSVQLCPHRGKQPGLAQDAVAREAAITLVKGARLLRACFEIRGDRNCFLRRHRVVQRAVLIQRPLAAAEDAPKPLAKRRFHLPPEHTWGTVEVSLHHEDRIVRGAGEHRHRHEVKGRDLARQRGILLRDRARPGFLSEPEFFEQRGQAAAALGLDLERHAERGLPHGRPRPLPERRCGIQRGGAGRERDVEGDR